MNGKKATLYDYILNKLIQCGRKIVKQKWSKHSYE